MLSRVSRARLASTLALVLMFVARVCQARDAAGFLDALQQTLASPQVYLASTTPFSPLVTAGNRVVQFFPGTQAATRSLCDHIERAEHEILLQAYEWNDCDEAGRLVRDALRARMRRARHEARLTPLVVRIVVNDSWPTRHESPSHLLTELFQEARRYDPSGEHVLVQLNRRKGLAFSVVHAKYAVIDGDTLLLRTHNFITMDGVARDYFNFMVQLEGPVAGTVRDDWLNLQAESVVAYHASHRPKSWPQPPTRDARATRADGEAEAAPVPMAVLAKNSRANFVTEGATNPQNAGLLSLIAATEHEILSLNPALNVPAIKRALVEAIVMRGVDVTLVLSLNMNRQVQHVMQGGDNADTLFEIYGQLLARGGVDAARRLHVSWASQGTGRPAPDGVLGNNHSKTSFYDGEALWVGSMNWDWQSWNNSRELSVVIFDPAVAPRWEQQIWRPIWRLAAPLAVDDLPQCTDRATRQSPVCRYLEEEKRSSAAELSRFAP